ncbi:MAG: GNAT family N-acetyltransferase [Ignavibacterium sp.]|nr:GNAT family N-acetyltransferase [Ignavibacterium sp.]
MDIIIKKLDRNYLKTNIEAFINILKNEPYEYWDEQNFLIDLLYKYDLSYYLELDEVLVSYIISSIKQNRVAYIHKFMTDKNYRSKGLGSLIFKVFVLNCSQNNISEIQLSVIKSNDAAIKFYSNNGFSIISDKWDNINNIESLLMLKKI